MLMLLVGFIAGVASVYWEQTFPTWLWLSSAVFACFLVIFVRKFAVLANTKPYRACQIAILIFSFVAGHGDAYWQLEQRIALRIDQPIQVSATVVVPQISDGVGEHWRQVVDVVQVEGDLPQPQRWLLFASSGGVNDHQVTKMRPGQCWQLVLTLKPPHGLASTGAFDQEKWLLTEHISAIGYVKTAKLLQSNPVNPGWMSAFNMAMQQQRLSIREHFQQFNSPATGVLLGLLTGDRSLIDPATTQLYQSMGISHLLAISGPHVVLAALMFSWVFRLLLNQIPSVYLMVERQRWLIPGFVLLVVLYACLAGFDLPAQRTVLMVSITSALLWWRIGHRTLTVLLYAAALILLFDPLAILSPAFWLSFVATALLIAMFRLPLRVGDADQPLSIGTNIRWACWQFIILQWRMFVLLTPLVLINFQGVSLLSLPVNLLAIPLLSAVVVPANLIALLLCFISPTGADAIWHLLLWVLQHFHQLLSAIEQVFPQAMHPVAMTPLKSVALLLAMLVLILPRGILPQWWLLFLAVPFYVPAPLVAPLLVQVLDVGQGLSVLLQTQHHAMLVDTGGKLPHQRQGMGERVVLPALRAQGIGRLDKLMLTHLDNDHSGGAPAILASLPVTQLTSSEPFDTYPTYLCEAGQQWWWDSVHFEVLSPTADMHGDVDANDASCVLKVSTSASATVPAQRVLIMGDAGIYPEYLLLSKQVDVKADVLVLGHHGSRFSSSSEFLQAVQPQRAVVSAGYLNRYHHPAPVVLARLNEQGVAVDSTIDSGTLTYKLGQSKQITPEQYREQHAWLQHD